MAWDSQRVIAVDQHPGVAYDYYAQQQAYAGRCESAMNETGILPYLGTTYHARDMLEILDQTGHKKLRYWGISYGTVLAGVFATLFPDRVERMVSDGMKPCRVLKFPICPRQLTVEQVMSAMIGG